MNRAVFFVSICLSFFYSNDVSSQNRVNLDLDAADSGNQVGDVPRADSEPSVQTLDCAISDTNRNPLLTEQNNEPDKLINYSWKVMHTKQDMTNKDCGKRYCLCKSDLFKVVNDVIPQSQSDFNPTLIIISKTDDAIYHFPSVEADFDIQNNPPAYAKMTFIDDVSVPKECREIILTHVRLDGSNPSQRNCESYLNFVGVFSPVDVGEACGKRNAVHWRIIERKRPDCGLPEENLPIESAGNNLNIRSVPEPGQGTASGTVN